MFLPYASASWRIAEADSVFCLWEEYQFNRLRNTMLKYNDLETVLFDEEVETTDEAAKTEGSEGGSETEEKKEEGGESTE